MRTDDQAETIRERLRVFREKTAPVVEYYRASGDLQVVDGSLDPEVVFSQIVADAPEGHYPMTEESHLPPTPSEGS